MNLLQALMEGQELSLEAAQEYISEMKERTREGEDPVEVLHDYGLEPDYLLEIL